MTDISSISGKVVITTAPVTFVSFFLEKANEWAVVVTCFAGITGGFFSLLGIYSFFEKRARKNKVDFIEELSKKSDADNENS
jgi:RsiW-degrading membrane proteinase PrsW (M82 family)